MKFQILLISLEVIPTKSQEFALVHAKDGFLYQYLAIIFLTLRCSLGLIRDCYLEDVDFKALYFGK